MHRPRLARCSSSLAPVAPRKVLRDRYAKVCVSFKLLANLREKGMVSSALGVNAGFKVVAEPAFGEVGATDDGFSLRAGLEVEYLGVEAAWAVLRYVGVRNIDETIDEIAATGVMPPQATAIEILSCLRMSAEIWRAVDNASTKDICMPRPFRCLSLPIGIASMTSRA